MSTDPQGVGVESAAPERARRASGGAADSSAVLPDPEDASRPGRRRFSAAYKRRVLEETDQLREPGIALFTPADVHQGLIEPRLRTRQATLDAAFRAQPNRFKGAPPVAQRPPNAVWINPPETSPNTPDISILAP